MKRQILSLLGGLTIFLCLYLAWAGLGTVHAQTTPPKITTKLSLTTAKVQRGRSVSASLVLEIPRATTSTRMTRSADSRCQQR